MDAFRKPADPSVKIWRYMDFWKFASMLENAGLFFCRLDCLPDKFEGSMSKPDYERFLTAHGATVMKASRHFGEIHSRKRVMVNCWSALILGAIFAHWTGATQVGEIRRSLDAAPGVGDAIDEVGDGPSRGA